VISRRAKYILVGSAGIILFASCVAALSSPSADTRKDRITPVVTTTTASPVTSTSSITEPIETTEPPVQTTQAPEPVVIETTNKPSQIYYGSCSEVRQAGAAPLSQGEPGYRAGLDRDSDGMACE